ncbi:hypothetical protein [Halalkalibacter akibai]|uniref:Uncharacterized protein n=1 Tax=Halalkalibacter akibai (strain ATCC 43226 / DSM 21942 / CIP 109018 / JCM 9157 / 1139) TaxID=1236973 RepID=W4QTQ2_HALA3|nr:hypothetical protein [Halalkalibacter akibai]GAE35540.1 hypothetical protein JCM9157_2652 [Halalkalibacter akibai JCM 9157]
MFVNELIETKEMFTGEIADNFYVVYEETLNKDFVLKNNVCLEKDRFVEKVIYIFKGDSCSSLQKIKAYPVESLQVEKIKELIVHDLPELFNKVG